MPTTTTPPARTPPTPPAPPRQNALDLLRIDLVAAGLHHVVRTAGEEQAPTFVAIAEVAGRVEFAFGKFVEAFVIHMADHHMRTAQMNFAVLAGRAGAP